MNENFIHYIWKLKLYKPGLYHTTSNQTLEIINPGLHNLDAGPDFFNAKVIIDGILWAGNIEIHHTASDWFRHGHHLDKAFDNVVLHVVMEDDVEVTSSSGGLIPAWKVPVEEDLIERYRLLSDSEEWISCAGKLAGLSGFEINNWLERLLIEKIEQKSVALENLLAKSLNNWDECFYILLARNFGYGVNSQPLEQLARQTPWGVVLKYSDDRMLLEALFLGQAGFLNAAKNGDEYLSELKREYSFISRKHNLKPLTLESWKFLRLRPSNFPTIRLVQLAWLMHQQRATLSRVAEADSLNQLMDIFKVSPDGYWSNHYRPGVTSHPTAKTLGVKSRELLVINTVVPVLFARGKLRGDESSCHKALDWLQELPPESNSIIEKWQQLGVKALNAAHSQALVYLKQNYCNHRRCLSCRIGHRIMTIKG